MSKKNIIGLPKRYLHMSASSNDHQVFHIVCLGDSHVAFYLNREAKNVNLLKISKGKEVSLSPFGLL